MYLVIIWPPNLVYKLFWLIYNAVQTFSVSSLLSLSWEKRSEWKLKLRRIGPLCNALLDSNTTEDEVHFLKQKFIHSFIFCPACPGQDLRGLEPILDYIGQRQDTPWTVGAIHFQDDLSFLQIWTRNLNLNTERDEKKWLNIHFWRFFHWVSLVHIKDICRIDIKSHHIF